MERTNNKLNPHIALTPGFEAGQHERWWDTSALTTAPPLLPGYYPVLRSFEKWITQKNSKNSNFILNLHHRGLNRPFLETEIRLLSLLLKEKNSSFTTFLMINMFSCYIMIGSDDVCWWPLWKITRRFSKNRNSKRIYLVFDVGRQKMIVISKLSKERLRVSGVKPKRSLLKILRRK